MDTMEFNKIAGAVLSALLIIFGGSTLIHEMQASHDKHGHGKAAYKLADLDDADHGDKKPEAKEADIFETVQPMLASADADQGAKVFGKCKACHTVNDGGRNGVGPNLWNIVNRDIANVDGFKYSGVLTEKDGAWDWEALVRFLHKPKEWAPGTKMGFGGLKKPEDVANVVAYLNTLSASPAALPTASAPAAEDKPAQ